MKKAELIILVALIVVAIIVLIVYGNKPMSEVPMWVWWLMN